MQVNAKALAHPDPKAALRAVMRSWLPLSEAVLNMTVNILPDPIRAAPERIDHLLTKRSAQLRKLHASDQSIQVIEWR